MSPSARGGPEESGQAHFSKDDRSINRLSPDEISLSDLIRILRRRKWIIFASVIAAFLLGCAYCIFKTPRYEAVADLAINPEGSNSLNMGDVMASIDNSGIGFDQKLETQVRILKSDSLAWTVISELRLDRRPAFNGSRRHLFSGPGDCAKVPDQIEQTSAICRNALMDRFASSLTVRSIPRTQAVEITFRNPDPGLARDIVNHLVSDYTQRTFMTRYNAAMKASDWLSGQMEQIKADVEKSETKLSDLQKETGIFGTDENNNLVLSKLDDLSKELTDAEADRITKEAQYRIVESGNPELIGTIASDTVLPVLRGQEADLKNQLAQATSEYGPNYPAVVQLRNQLAEVDRSVNKEIANIQERFRSDYAVSVAAETEVKKAFEQQKQLANNMSAGLDRYGILKREVEAGNDLYEDLMTKLKEAGVIASLKAVTVDPIDSAKLPTSPVEPDTHLVLALSTLFGLGTGIALSFVAESFDHLIWNSEEIRDLVNVPLFGIVPHIKPAPQAARPLSTADAKSVADPAFVILQRPKSQGSEAFRALRTAILLASPGAPPKTILVTSAIPGEGKTTIGINICFALNQLGRRVLLVDADLRRGKIGDKFDALGSNGVPGNAGLSGALTGGNNWRDAVKSIPDVPNLFILPSGVRPPNSAELLGSAEMQALLEQWRAEFDHVILDSAPVLLVTDAVLIAQKVDMVLLVSRIGVTSRTGLRRASELMHTGRASISGMIVNDTGVDDRYYGYGYGYGYGNKSAGGYYSDEKA